MSIYSIDECIKWKENKSINPKTNRPIKIGAATYNELEKQCYNYNIASMFHNFCKNNKSPSHHLNSNEKIIYKKFNNFCENIEGIRKRKHEKFELTTEKKEKKHKKKLESTETEKIFESTTEKKEKKHKKKLESTETEEKEERRQQKKLEAKEKEREERRQQKKLEAKEKEREERRQQKRLEEKEKEERRQQKILKAKQREEKKLKIKEKEERKEQKLLKAKEREAKKKEEMEKKELDKYIVAVIDKKVRNPEEQRIINMKKKSPIKYIEYLKEKKDFGEYSNLTDSQKKDLKLILDKEKNRSSSSLYYSDELDDELNFSSNNCITLIPSKKQEKPAFSLFSYFQNPKINYDYLLMNNNIKLNKQFGIQKDDSIIYKAKNINKKKNKFIKHFLIKITLQQEETNNTIDLFKKLSLNAVKKNIRHIPLYYNYTICNEIIRKAEYPKLLNTAKKYYKYYSLLFFENADGDLSSFIDDFSIDKNMWKNIYEQLYMSICMLHYMGYIHNNINKSNFLFRVIEKEGCFHYRIGDEDYYIKNLGIIWMIWDYEKCEKIDTSVKYLFLQDYYKTNIELCHRNMELEHNPIFLIDTNNPLGKDDKISGKLDDKITLPSNIKNLQYELWQKFINESSNSKSIIKECAKGNMNSNTFIKLLKDEDLLFSKLPIGKIIYSTII